MPMNRLNDLEREAAEVVAVRQQLEERLEDRNAVTHGAWVVLRHRVPPASGLIQTNQHSMMD